MRRFGKGMGKWIKYVCFMYTGCVLIYGAAAFATGEENIQLEILFEIFLISLVGTLLQGIAFDEEWLIRRMAYTGRLILFAGMFLPVLTGIALLFQWFPADRMVSWGIFLGIFLAIFLGTTAAFEVAFRIAGKKYDGLLGQYHRQKKGQNQD